jgi:hypothetical protein
VMTSFAVEEMVRTVVLAGPVSAERSIHGELQSVADFATAPTSRRPWCPALKDDLREVMAMRGVANPTGRIARLQDSASTAAYIEALTGAKPAPSSEALLAKVDTTRETLAVRTSVRPSK